MNKKIQLENIDYLIIENKNDCLKYLFNSFK